MTVLQFRKPAAAHPAYVPDPRNGEVYVTSGVGSHYEPDGQEFDGPLEYMWIHMSSGGGSASCGTGFTTPEAAERAAFNEAKRLNAVFIPLTVGGNS